MNRIFKLFRSGIVDASAAVAEPVIRSIDLGDDGSVTIVEDGEPIVAAPAPAAEAPRTAVLNVEDLVGFVRSGGQQQQEENKPVPAPSFDATSYVIKGSGPNDPNDGAIDMEGLGKGIDAYVNTRVEAAINQVLQVVEGRLGGSVQSIEADRAAAQLAAEHGLDDDARAIIAQELGRLPLGTIPNLPKASINLLVNAAENMSRAQKAKQQDPAAPGANVRARTYQLAVADPEGIGWSGYCRMQGWDPKDPAVIKLAVQRGVLK